MKTAQFIINAYNMRSKMCAYLHKEHDVEMDTDEEVSDEEKVDDNDETQE